MWSYLFGSSSMEREQLLCVRFNQTNECFVCGTQKGFTVYNCDPFKERFQRDLNGGVGIVEMLFRTNIFAVVGGGPKPCFPSNCVRLWDDKKNNYVAEFSFNSAVVDVRLRRHTPEDKEALYWVIIALETKIYLYDFQTQQLLDYFDTQPTVTGVFDLNMVKPFYFACPTMTPGELLLVNYGKNKERRRIQAHVSVLHFIKLNQSNSIVATASERGTLIRLFDIETGTLLREFRRGADTAQIYSLTFRDCQSLLCVSSSKGTIHLFSLDGDNQVSTLQAVKAVLPSYFGSEWSFNRFQLPEAPSVCAFGPHNLLYVLLLNGDFYHYRITSINSREAVQEAYYQYH